MKSLKLDLLIHSVKNEMKRYAKRRKEIQEVEGITVWINGVNYLWDGIMKDGEFAVFLSDNYSWRKLLVRYTPNPQKAGRTLTKTQRALILARFWSSDRNSGELTQEEVLKKFQVSFTFLQRAEFVLKKGIPELVEAAGRNKISLARASQISELSHEDQARFLAVALKQKSRAEKRNQKRKRMFTPPEIL